MQKPNRTLLGFRGISNILATAKAEMEKKEVAAILEEIAFLLELAGENPFKVRAYEAGARAVLTFPGDLE